MSQDTNIYKDIVEKNEQYDDETKRSFLPAVRQIRCKSNSANSTIVAAIVER